MENFLFIIFLLKAKQVKNFSGNFSSFSFIGIRMNMYCRVKISFNNRIILTCRGVIRSVTDNHVNSAYFSMDSFSGLYSNVFISLRYIISVIYTVSSGTYIRIFSKVYNFIFRRYIRFFSSYCPRNIFSEVPSFIFSRGFLYPLPLRGSWFFISTSSSME